MPDPVTLDGGGLTIGQVEAVAVGGAHVRLGDEARRRVDACRAAMLAAIAGGGACYGVNTGFGSLSRERIAPADLRTLQENLVRSHAAGVGAPLPEHVTRAMLLALAGSLSRGLSGVRSAVIDAVLALLNAGATPVVPETGSVGASGDLAPLAHAALVLIGEGRARVAGREVAGRDALAAAGIASLRLEAKEGLALLNGTHLMAGWGALLCARFERVFRAAAAAAAMTIDACKGTDACLDSRAHDARAQPGVALVARRLRELLAGSEIVRSHRAGDLRVQDPYSLRCAPAVLGAAWDAFCFVRDRVAAELHAVTDNPLVLTRGGGGAEVVSAGNFHGMPVAIPLDVLAIATAHVATISERRVYWLLSAREAESGVPRFLARRAGLESGLMIAQYAAAACVNELAGLASPASVVNIPTSDGMEDVNSFGPRGAAKAWRGLDLLESVVAIELLCGAEGLEFHRPLRSGEGVERVHAAVRRVVPARTGDRPPAPDIDAIRALVAAGEIG
jgi:histidine ammonia-lyase